MSPYRNCIAGLSLITVCAFGQQDRTNDTIPAGGITEWITTAEGPMKTRIYANIKSDTPVLIIALHGDIPDPPPSYQYYFAQATTEGYDAVSEMPTAVRAALQDQLPLPEDIIAAGILRPGYTDAEGDTSAGNMGFAVSDNMTAEVVDAVALAVRYFSERYHPRKVVLVGHSGGAGIAANVMGRHPGIADAALLVACGCDPDAYYAMRKAEEPAEPFWNTPNPSLRPLALAATVATDARIRLVAGDQDPGRIEISEAYANALKLRGIDASVRVEPGLGHNILFTPPVFEELRTLLSELDPGDE